MVLAATKNLSTEAMSKFSQAKDNHFQLLYFPFHGVVSALRTMLAISGAKYTFTHPENWELEKQQTPFGHMPVLYETTSTGETLELAELSVIEFYLASKFGFMGSNAWEDQLVRSYTTSTQALFEKFVVSVIRMPKDLQPQLTQAFVEKQIPEWVEFHERILKANGSNGHYIGNQLTFADIKASSVMPLMMKLSGDKYISKELTPALMALYETMEANPKYAAWKASEAYEAYTEATRKLFGL
ncbi:hypothetical protein BGZ68_006145 [Mortierella alpina]|nr:hypothetical protein BGZ68_006145 [Mortierella alpina]